MRRFFIGVILCMIMTGIQAQEYNLEELNKYKYVSVETLIDKRRDRVDPWGVSTYTRFKLIQSGFVVIDDKKESWTEEARFNQCLVLTCDINDRTRKLGRNRVEMIFRNCHGDTLFINRGSGYEETERDSYHKSVDLALEPLDTFQHQFNPELSLDPILPDVETNSDSEAELKAYFDSNSSNPVEGIYAFTSEYNYRIGVKKEEDNYEGSILSSNAPYWKEYEVKIYLEISPLGDDVFNITWLDDKKSKSETVGKIIGNTIVMEIRDGSVRKTIKLVKEYPKSENTE